jgi:CheY-like chemotaxis protein
MARILIIEPHAEVRDLLARIVVRMGHEPVPSLGSGEDDLSGIDVVLLEPAAWEGVDTARAARAKGARIVGVSIFPASEEARALEPVAYLLKPFSLADLERAIAAAVAAGEHVGAA